MNKRVNFCHILDALGRLYTTADIHGPGLHFIYRLTHITCGQAAGQHQIPVPLARHQTPVKDLTRAAGHAGLVAIEQNAGCAWPLRGHALQLISAAYPHRLEIRASELTAIVVTLLAMKLQQIQRHLCQHRAHSRRLGINKQANRGYKRRQCGHDARRLGGIDCARTGSVKHQADGIGTGCGCGQRVLLAGNATYLDSGHRLRAYLSGFKGNRC